MWSFVPDGLSEHASVAAACDCFNLRTTPGQQNSLKRISHPVVRWHEKELRKQRFRGAVNLALYARQLAKALHIRVACAQGKWTVCLSKLKRL